MKVAGDRKFDVPQQTVWEVLNDPARLAKTIPGVESFEVQDERVAAVWIVRNPEKLEHVDERTVLA